MIKFTQTRDFCAESVAMTAKDVFLTQLNYIYYGIEQNGGITRNVVLSELGLNKNQKHGLINKMLSKNTKAYTKHSSNLQLILSLLDNLNLDYLDCKNMKQIISNSSDIYEQYYREKYETIQRDIFMQGHMKYMEGYEI